MSEIFSLILFIVFIVYILFENKEKLKMLKVHQIFGIGIVFMISVGIAATIIYYGGNWVVGKIPYEWARWIVSFFIIAVVIAVTKIYLNKLAGKITHGVFGSK
ncbi:hypothetical protein [Virgibacillus sp. YIM 98842]|uniref:hypothetical protein n=1 Tax=Virgibacillus sp. YIM 98842 TaxID=2663533 RepID=UPI0013DABE97|nr:hypothetical protein [Virgibacillus sp. YIM 98842]